MSLAVAALGGVLYVVLTWVTSWVYQPAGVRPSDVGLGYVPLLAGAAEALIAALAFVLAAVAIAFGVVWLRKKNLWAFAAVTLVLVALAVLSFVFEVPGSAGVFLFSLPVAAYVAGIWPERAYKVIAILATIYALAAAGITLWNSAVVARDNLTTVTALNAIGVFNNPWEGQIANVQQIGSTTSTCGLYLGESNGTGVFVYEEGTGQSKHLRTLRLPLSSVIIQILPDQVVC